MGPALGQQVGHETPGEIGDHDLALRGRAWFGDLLEVPVLTDPRLSPDGQTVVFVLAEADWKKNERVTHL